MCGRQVAARIGREGPPWRVQRLPQLDREAAECDGHEIIGHADVLAGQCDDVLDLLAEDENECRGRASARTQVAAVDDFGERGLLVGTAELPAGTPAVLGDGWSAASEPILDRPIQETVGDQPRGRTTGDQSSTSLCCRSSSVTPRHAAS
jgi:hypothetical protein